MYPVNYFEEIRLLEDSFWKSLVASQRINQPASFQYYLNKWLAFSRQDEQKSYTFLRAGTLLAEEGEFENAAELYQGGLTLLPRNPSLNFQLFWRLAFTLIQMGSTKEAIEFSNNAIQLHPEQAGGHLILGLAQEVVGDYPAALEAYGSATTLPLLDNEWFALTSALANQLSNNKNGSQSPRLPAPLRILAALFTLTEAVPDKEIELVEIQGKLWINDRVWGEMYQPLIKDMLSSLKRPVDSQILCLQGIFQQLENSRLQLTPSGQNLLQTQFLSPSPAQPDLNLKGLMKPDGGILFEGHLTAKNRFLEGVLRSIEMYHRQNEWEKAEAEIELMMILADSSEELAYRWMQKGVWQERFKEFQGAIDSYQEGLKIEQSDHRNTYFLHNNTGYCLVQLGKFMEAEEWCRKAIQIESDQNNAHKNLGLALKGQGRYTEAASSFIESVKIWPADRRAYDQLRELLVVHSDLVKTHPEFNELLDSAEAVVENSHLIGRAIHRDNGDTSSLPAPLRILVAATQVVEETQRKVFTPDELRIRIKVEKDIWEASFAPVLRQMSNGKSKTDEDELRACRGVFKMQGLTELRFTERGEKMAELVSVLITE